MTFVGFRHAFNNFLQTVQRPLIHFFHLVVVHHFRVNIEIIEVAKNETAGIADPAISLHQAFKNFLGNANVVRIIFGRDPEAKNFSAVFGNRFFRADDVADRFGHFLAVAVHNKTVRENTFVRRTPAGSHGFQQR